MIHNFSIRKALLFGSQAFFKNIGLWLEVMLTSFFVSVFSMLGAATLSIGSLVLLFIFSLKKQGHSYLVPALSSSAFLVLGLILMLTLMTGIWLGSYIIGFDLYTRHHSNLKRLFDQFPRSYRGLVGWLLFITVPLLWIAITSSLIYALVGNPAHTMSVVMMGVSVIGLIFAWVLPHYFWPLVFVEKQTSVQRSFAESRELTSGNLLKLFLYFIVTFIILSIPGSIWAVVQKLIPVQYPVVYVFGGLVYGAVIFGLSYIIFLATISVYKQLQESSYHN